MGEADGAVRADVVPAQPLRDAALQVPDARVDLARVERRRHPALVVVPVEEALDARLRHPAARFAEGPQERASPQPSSPAFAVASAPRSSASSAALGGAATSAPFTAE